MKALVIYKKSTNEIYSASPDEAVQKFIQDENNKYLTSQKRSRDEQKRTLDAVVSELNRRKINHEVLWRGDVKSVEGSDLVISVGGDGTFLDVSHHINNDIPVMGINSDCNSSVGFYCCFNRQNFGDAIANLEKLPRTKVLRIEGTLNGIKIPQYVLNDLLVADENPAATTDIEVNGKRGKRSSGLIVSTPMGSTAWVYEEGGIIAPLESTEMQYIYRSRRKKESFFAKEIEIYSLTRKGKIYFDGQHLVYDFTIGDKIHLELGAPLTIIGDFSEKRKKYESMG